MKRTVLQRGGAERPGSIASGRRVQVRGQRFLTISQQDSLISHLDRLYPALSCGEMMDNGNGNGMILLRSRTRGLGSRHWIATLVECALQKNLDANSSCQSNLRALSRGPWIEQ